MTVRTFGLSCEISTEFLLMEPRKAEQFARRNIAAMALLLTGPRGGRYEPVSKPYGYNVTPHPDRFVYVMTARVNARYVRPDKP